MKFLRRLDPTEYVADQTVTIGSGGGSFDVLDIPTAPDTALEIEGDDGNVYVVLAYKRK